jgi:hypothetical protein
MSTSLCPFGHDAAGQPRTFRVRRRASQPAAYRHLLITIVGLDVRTLTSELRAARLGRRRREQHCTPLRAAA